MANYRHVIWDMGGTLADTYSSVDATLLEVATAAGAAVEPMEVSRLTRGSIASAIEELAGRFGIDQERFERAYADLKSSWNQTPPPVMPGAREVIDRVRAHGGLNLVVTHRDPESAQVVIDRLGLPIDGMICAGEGLRRKPAPDMFQALLERHGLASNSCLAVGDRPIDAQAAQAAGIDAALLETPGIPMEAESRYHITALVELLELIGHPAAG